MAYAFWPMKRGYLEGYEDYAGVPHSQNHSPGPPQHPFPGLEMPPDPPSWDDDASESEIRCWFCDQWFRDAIARDWHKKSCKSNPEYLRTIQMSPSAENPLLQTLQSMGIMSKTTSSMTMTHSFKGISEGLDLEALKETVAKLVGIDSSTIKLSEERSPACIRHSKWDSPGSTPDQDERITEKDDELFRTMMSSTVEDSQEAEDPGWFFGENERDKEKEAWEKFEQQRETVTQLAYPGMTIYNRVPSTDAEIAVASKKDSAQAISQSSPFLKITHTQSPQESNRAIPFFETIALQEVNPVISRKSAVEKELLRVKQELDRKKCLKMTKEDDRGVEKVGSSLMEKRNKPKAYIDVSELEEGLDPKPKQPVNESSELLPYYYMIPPPPLPPAALQHIQNTSQSDLIEKENHMCYSLKEKVKKKPRERSHRHRHSSSSSSDTSSDESPRRRQSDKTVKRRNRARSRSSSLHYRHKSHSFSPRHRASHVSDSPPKHSRLCDIFSPPYRIRSITPERRVGHTVSPFEHGLERSWTHERHSRDSPVIQRHYSSGDASPLSERQKWSRSPSSSPSRFMDYRMFYENDYDDEVQQQQQHPRGSFRGRYRGTRRFWCRGRGSFPTSEWRQGAYHSQFETPNFVESDIYQANHWSYALRSEDRFLRGRRFSTSEEIGDDMESMKNRRLCDSKPKSKEINVKGLEKTVSNSKSQFADEADEFCNSSKSKMKDSERKRKRKGRHKSEEFVRVEVADLNSKVGGPQSTSEETDATHKPCKGFEAIESETEQGLKHASVYDELKSTICEENRSVIRKLNHRASFPSVDGTLTRGLVIDGKSEFTYHNSSELPSATEGKLKLPRSKDGRISNILGIGNSAQDDNQSVKYKVSSETGVSGVSGALSRVGGGNSTTFAVSVSQISKDTTISQAIPRTKSRKPTKRRREQPKMSQRSPSPDFDSLASAIAAAFSDEDI